jgi:N-acetylglucosamine kinase-like BadF-type ATPase
MILIADSGSSKTDWLLIKDNQTIENIETPGINPFFQKTEEITEMLLSVFPEEIKKQKAEIHFYGAGCIKGKTDSIIRNALKTVFPLAETEVEDDMLGAARSLLGNQAGIACILGTGSNSCKYDGEKIIDKIPPLGFILGDEGSGAWLGKIFLNNYFKRAIPADLKAITDSELKLEMPKVLSAVYKEEYPSRYLAGFSKFIIKNGNHPYIKKLIRNGFDAFLTNNVEKYSGYKSLPVNFVGSIAFYYADLLRDVAKSKYIKVSKILHKPIEGLIEYHLGRKNQ